MRCDTDYVHLSAAGRLALRGHGRAEPNPLVGCVIVSPDGTVVGWGYHARCGGPHAEVVALRRAGEAARGSTAYITLAPCNHVGRTGACSRALIEVGVSRVVVARDDPNPIAGGGLDALRAAGVAVETMDICPEATRVSDPFVHRIRTGLPWVTVKWAQTIDGRIATRAGESKWISSDASRQLVHRERGRVDAIVTGIGTVLADDPMLTARGVRIRRIARRTVIDPELKIPLACRLVATARQIPTTIFCSDASVEQAAERADELRRVGVEVVPVACGSEHGDRPKEARGAGRMGAPSFARAILRALVVRHDATHVLIEAGPGLMSRILREGLANEAWVFVAPRLLGDDAVPVVRGLAVEHLADATHLRLVDHRTRGGDVVLRYRLGPQGGGR